MAFADFVKGKKEAKEPDTIECPECGEDIPAGSTKCPECDEPLGKGKPNPLLAWMKK